MWVVPTCWMFHNLKNQLKIRTFCLSSLAWTWFCQTTTSTYLVYSYKLQFDSKSSFWHVPDQQDDDRNVIRSHRERAERGLAHLRRKQQPRINSGINYSHTIHAWISLLWGDEGLPISAQLLNKFGYRTTYLNCFIILAFNTHNSIPFRPIGAFISCL